MTKQIHELTILQRRPYPEILNPLTAARFNIWKIIFFILLMQFTGNLSAGNITDGFIKYYSSGLKSEHDVLRDTNYIYWWIHICEGDTFDFYGTPITMPGYYEQVIGMDSIVVLVLSFYNSPVLFGDFEICEGDSIEIYGQIYSQEGVYHLETTDIFGCTIEGTISIHWYVVDTAVVRQGDRLVALATASTFQWFDCTTGLPIPEASQRTFIPPANGSFRVAVTSINGCTAYSGCFDITFVSTMEAETYQWQINPNPTNDFLDLITDSQFRFGLKVEIIDFTGRLHISETLLISETHKRIDVSTLPPGIFLIILNDKGGYSTSKVFLKN